MEATNDQEMSNKEEMPISEEIEEIFKQLLGEDPEIIVLPASVGGINSIFLKLKDVIKRVAVKQKKSHSIYPSDLKQTISYLGILYNLDVFYPTYKKSAKVDKVLGLFMDPLYKFSEHHVKVASHIYNDLAARNWGEEDVGLAAEIEDQDIEDQGLFVQDGPVNASNGSSDGSTFTRPHRGDPIYGAHGPMANILRGRSTDGKAVYVIDPTYHKRGACSIGHNRINVGDCFATQMAMLRDGAHGVRIGGVHGSLKHGTFSIVVSGKYHTLDEDFGDILYYSGSNAHENTKKKPDDSLSTKYLSISASTRRPVRVFRSSRAKWAGAPKAGFRYDGLYEVVGSSIELNAKNGAYKRFKLVRRTNQAPIDTNAPDAATAALFNRVKNGYTTQA